MTPDVDAAPRPAGRELLLSAAVGGASLALLALLGARARAGEVYGWDARLNEALSQHSRPEFNELGDDLIAFFLRYGTNLVTLALLAGSAYLIVRRRRLRAAGFVAGSFVVAGLLTLVFKALFERPEMGAYAKYELPSGHATRSAVAAGAVAVLAWGTRRQWPAVVGGALFVLAAAAALVYADWHLPTDVLGGWALAAAVLAAARAVFLPQEDVPRRRSRDGP